MAEDYSKAINNIDISLHRGDITRETVEAIVNAANSSLMGGGGVDGAIHRAAGPTVLEECKQIKAIQGPCTPGNAVITGGGKLAAQYIIHTVGPIWRGGTTNENQILSNAYQNSLQLAVDNQVASIAFPSISTGAYGYPVAEAAKVAISTIKDFIEKLDKDTELKQVRFVLFDDVTYDAYKAVLADI
jgi:O-acetyl-ADP-ribose deacetylase (regulator of RNase III)